MQNVGMWGLPLASENDCGGEIERSRLQGRGGSRKSKDRV